MMRVIMMTKPPTSEIIWVSKPLPRDDDGEIDWERMVARLQPSPETVEQVNRWVSTTDPEVVQQAELQIRACIDHWDRNPDPQVEAVLERLQRRHRPAMCSDIEDLHDDLQDMLVGLLMPLRQQSSRIGRPEKPIKDTLRILAGRWIGHNGRPTVRARLEEYLSQVAEDHGEPISKDTAQKLAQEAVDADRAHNPDIADD